jgi:hypothetical protein
MASNMEKGSGGSAYKGTSTPYQGGGRFGAPSANRSTVAASSYPKVGAPATKPKVAPAAVARRVTKPVVRNTPAPAPRKTVTTARPSGTIVKAAPKAAPKSAPVAKPVSAPKAPVMSEQDKINAYLRGDTTYIQQQADSKLAGENFGTQWADQNTNYGSEFALNQANLNKAKGEADTAMTDDFAARGALSGSGYADAYQNQQTEFDSRQKAMEQAQTQFGTDQGAAQTNFNSQQTLTDQKARADAINRRAAGLAL